MESRIKCVFFFLGETGFLGSIYSSNWQKKKIYIYIYIYLEPQTTIKKWMFGETTISYVKIGNLFGVPGIHISIYTANIPSTYCLEDFYDSCHLRHPESAFVADECP